ncbi:HD domain-containing protein [Methanocalculus sp.]|uniref:HD domain-containing protein n=1 Tax=Methanocalculus sp. TaxID=2004547 RepID=UPI00262CC907|nr:HD domain-containing protein [Methanocalculus sp.]MDG6250259.1 HD domain-containing protein [Methanocalculus sp.]
MTHKKIHEIRDPIHIFIHMDSNEREVLNSTPVQRLRYVHQLALTYQVYPGSTHRRFEHSLGVMELATRIFDTVMLNLSRSPKDFDFDIGSDFDREYWRRTLRMAALVHDIGHSPFSHASEDLFPDSWNHEKMTLELIESPEMNTLWRKLKISSEDVAKLAVGPKYYEKSLMKDHETIFSEIITGDAFGADRMDYLLRDTYHAGAAYGKFDHYRLIETLRILPKRYDDSDEPALGVETGGIQSAEALLLARYFMFSQLYFHPIRRIYDIHLKDFLKIWLKDGYFPKDADGHLRLTDNEVVSAMYEAMRDAQNPAHEQACRIIKRKHFKVLYSRNPDDVSINRSAGEYVFTAACDQFGEENVRHDIPKISGSSVEFPVLENDNRVVSSLRKSETLQRLPEIALETVYIHPEKYDEAVTWLEKEREQIIELVIEEDV